MNLESLVILCGGLGTRLRPVLSEVPKVLAEINGRPFLEHVLQRIRNQGFRTIYLSVGHLAEQVEDFVDRRPADELTIRCVKEESPLGTAGALRHVWRSADVATPFVVLNGDTFFGGDLGALVSTHRAARAAATLAVVRVPEADRYGLVRFDADDHQVLAFEEKGSATGPSWINAGAYVLEEVILRSVPAGRAVSLEREVFPEWIGSGLLASPFPDASFLDIGTPEDYTRAQDFLT